MTRKHAPFAGPLALVASTMRWNRTGKSTLATLASPIGRSVKQWTPRLEDAIGNVARVSNVTSPLSKLSGRKGMAQRFFKGKQSKSWLERAGTISAVVGALSAGAELLREIREAQNQSTSSQTPGHAQDAKKEAGEEGSASGNGKAGRSSARTETHSAKTGSEHQHPVAKASTRSRATTKKTQAARLSSEGSTSSHSKASTSSGRTSTATDDG